ncbi:MAG: hypothetical protein Harvfovirus3_37 [Harvfovirus sp.]|uniref:Leucine-rich repeat protein n=1 Tax=Harvfovirus sp. TaxID=2487768 RepID=A0A3G5A0B1_9VIRU|nr:MAG: hypothetical protein Harvfovirus3_37 [Harvfovirus sp.]
MKAVRIVSDCDRKKAFTHSFSKIPPAAYLSYFETLELVILKRTHRFFCENKIWQSFTPIIHLRNPSHCKNLSDHFPKAKLIIKASACYILQLCSPCQLANIISLDFRNGPFSRIFNFSTLPKLTVLQLDNCYGLGLDDLNNMTQLVSLSLNFEVDRFRGSTLRKLTNLTKLSLRENTVITDLDIELLPLRSLSLYNNRTITPFVLKRLNLTQLDISIYATAALSGEIIQCTTITDLTLTMADINIIGKKVLASMTQLKKLTVQDPELLYEDCLKYLTNLTHLHFIGATKYEKLDLPSLQTIIIMSRWPWGYVPSLSLTNLTHLELEVVSHLADISCLINLTYLKLTFYRNGITPPQIPILPKKLKTLILLNLSSYDTINFVSLENLTTLEISVENDKVIHHLPVHHNLKKLTIWSGNAQINDHSLMQYTHVNHLTLLSLTTPLIGYCFEYMKGLLSLTIYRRKISDECHSQLIKRGIIVRDY